MSTRSCTTIHNSGYANTARGHKLCALYRHCDGYLAEAGAALVDALRNSKTPTDVVAWLLSQTYEATTYRPAQRIYELTSKAADHGDLEHEYEAWHAKDGWHVRHGKRRNWESDEFERHTYTLKEFVDVVNADRRGINARIDELRSEHPEVYKDAASYPMLALSIGGAS